MNWEVEAEKPRYFMARKVWNFLNRTNAVTRGETIPKNNCSSLSSSQTVAKKQHFYSFWTNSTTNLQISAAEDLNKPKTEISIDNQGFPR